MGGSASVRRENDRQRVRRLRFESQVATPFTPEWAEHSEDAIGVKEVAQMLGRGQTYVKTHAEELGGQKFVQQLGLTTVPGTERWLFSRARIQAVKF